MKVLILGSGGRESAIAKAVSRSPLLSELHAAPGSAGTEPYARSSGIMAEDVEGVAAYAAREGVDLAIVGPEAPLSLGVADALRKAGVACFGPSREAARLESSKAFSKAFMERHGIPTPRARAFKDPDQALAWALAAGQAGGSAGGSAGGPERGGALVVKASGLAAGKGVSLPEGRAELEAAIRDLFNLGGDGAEILVEERVFGQELSLIAFADGKDYALLPAARDHKRLLDGERGPNTGGMGAYAPACSQRLAERLAELFIAPALAGLAAEGCPFIGALYAGLILTEKGPLCLEYNARLGDPEAQAILPLFESDPLEAFLAAAKGELSRVRLGFRTGASAALVAAAPGYPESPRRGIEFSLPSELPEGCGIILSGVSALADASAQAGAVPAGAVPAGKAGGKRYATQSGRALAVLGEGADLPEALAKAYGLADSLDLPGFLIRRDIGAAGSLDGAALLSLEAREGGGGSATGGGARREANATSAPVAPAAAAPAAASSAAPAGGAPSPSSAYAAAGVDIDAGNRAVELMSAAVRSTYGPEVMAGIGSFGGLYDATALKAMDRPVLAASTDGVGTKSSLGAALGRWRGLGMDIVNHCVDDILVQGARPLFFLDYIASPRLDPEAVADIVGGMAEACREASCALIGGETAEMPGTYREGETDIAGTIVGLVEAGLALPRRDIAEGDVLIGLASAGLHTNGYSLARRALGGLELCAHLPELGESPADALLRPHRSYLPALWPWISREGSPVKALAHITGGGMTENIPRMLPPDLDALIRPGAWPVPPIFGLIERLGRVGQDEMRRVFNLGIGMVVVAEAERAEELSREIGSRMGYGAYRIGSIAPGSGTVRYV